MCTRRCAVTLGDADAGLVGAWRRARRGAAIGRRFKWDVCRDARPVSENAGMSESDPGGEQDNDRERPSRCDERRQSREHPNSERRITTENARVVVMSGGRAENTRALNGG